MVGPFTSPADNVMVRVYPNEERQPQFHRRARLPRLSLPLDSEYSQRIRNRNAEPHAFRSLTS